MKSCLSLLIAAILADTARSLPVVTSDHVLKGQSQEIDSNIAVPIVVAGDVSAYGLGPPGMLIPLAGSQALSEGIISRRQPLAQLVWPYRAEPDSDADADEDAGEDDRVQRRSVASQSTWSKEIQALVSAPQQIISNNGAAMAHPIVTQQTVPLIRLSRREAQEPEGSCTSPPAEQAPAEAQPAASPPELEVEDPDPDTTVEEEESLQEQQQQQDQQQQQAQQGEQPQAEQAQGETQPNEQPREETQPVEQPLGEAQPGEQQQQQQQEQSHEVESQPQAPPPLDTSPVVQEQGQQAGSERPAASPPRRRLRQKDDDDEDE